MRESAAEEYAVAFLDNQQDANFLDDEPYAPRVDDQLFANIPNDNVSQ